MVMFEGNLRFAVLYVLDDTDDGNHAVHVFNDDRSTLNFIGAMLGFRCWHSANETSLKRSGSLGGCDCGLVGGYTVLISGASDSHSI